MEHAMWVPTVLRWRLYFLENIYILAHEQVAIPTEDLQNRSQECQCYSRPVKPASHM
jgi:hypothetical protein